jgi:hypothetical protein
MGNFKVRRPILAMSEITLSDGLTIGSQGISASKMLFGKGTVTAISCGAASAGSALMTVANLATGDTIFINTGSMAACAIVGGASCLTASILCIKYYNAGSGAMADVPLSVAYLALA